MNGCWAVLAGEATAAKLPGTHVGAHLVTALQGVQHNSFIEKRKFCQEVNRMENGESSAGVWQG